MTLTKTLKIRFLLLITVSYMGASAQTVNDYQGKPLIQNSYFELDGTPFLSANWRVGCVFFKNESILKNVNLKYDLVLDKLLFEGKNGEELYFNEPITKFILNRENETKNIDQIFVNGLEKYKDFDSETFFEVLAGSKILLLKKTIKNVIEVREYNSATIQRKITTNNFYYISANNLVYSIAKKADIVEFNNLYFQNKSPELTLYLDSIKLNFRKETDLISLIKYYNTL